MEGLRLSGTWAEEGDGLEVAEIGMAEIQESGKK